MNNTLTLAAATGGVTPGTFGVINVNGGTLAANVIANGSGVGNINLLYGTLTVAGIAGTQTAPISSLSATNSVFNLPVISGSNVITTTSLRTAGASNVINIISAPPFPGYPAQVTLIKILWQHQRFRFQFCLGHAAGALCRLSFQQHGQCFG
ncbi:MAG: hypothetical protein WDM76_04605 [Limisphaerales bacterium]